MTLAPYSQSGLSIIGILLVIFIKQLKADIIDCSCQCEILIGCVITDKLIVLLV